MNLLNSTMRVLINLAIMVFIGGGVEVAYALENCSVKSDQMDRSLVRYVGGMRYQLKSSSNKASEVSYDCVRDSSVVESVATSILYSSNIEDNIVAVSYTHLTLPTILLV